MNSTKARKILLYLVGAFIGGLSIFGYYPAGIAYFTAMYLAHMNLLLLFPVMVIGMAFSVPMVYLVKYGAGMIVVIILIHMCEKKGKVCSARITGAIAGCISFILTAAGSLFQLGNDKGLIFGFLEAVLIFGLTDLFLRGIQVICEGKAGAIAKNENLVSVGLLLGMTLYSLPEPLRGGLAIVEVIIYFSILFFGYKYGSGTGAVIATACGGALTLWNGDMKILGIMCLLGILSGVFREMGRWVNGAAFFIGVAVTGIFAMPFFMEPEQMTGWLAGTLIFCILPSDLIYRCSERQENAKGGSNVVYEARGERLKDFAKSFQDLAAAFSALPYKDHTFSGADVDCMFEELSKNLCYSCENRNCCWKERFSKTYGNVYEMLSIIENKGALNQSDIPSEFLENCQYTEKFIEETERVFNRAKLNMMWKNKLYENRLAVAGQLGEMARIMVDVAGDIDTVKDTDDTLDEKLGRMLQTYGIAVKHAAILEKKDKKREVYLTMRSERGKCVSAKEIAGLVTSVCGKKMVPAKGSKNFIAGEDATILYVEDVNFKMLYSVERKVKESEMISGDNFAVIHADQGREVISLSDGMGSGLKASEESERVIELLEQFLEAGFKEDAAIKMINSAMVFKGNEESYSTIDIASIDLYSGVCDFLKVGASATFIKRSSWIETIQSTSLPAGMFHTIDCDAVAKKLYDGDFVIMMTDGMLDDLPVEDPEETVKDFIMEIETENPREFAKELMKKIFELKQQKATDDMTILVAGVWMK